jgi:hypothetical protein
MKHKNSIGYQSHISALGVIPTAKQVRSHKFGCFIGTEAIRGPGRHGIYLAKQTCTQERGQEVIETFLLNAG